MGGVGGGGGAGRGAPRRRLSRPCWAERGTPAGDAGARGGVRRATGTTRVVMDGAARRRQEGETSPTLTSPHWNGLDPVVRTLALQDAGGGVNAEA